ncbi:hypothetical protein BJ973_008052 [Actinoplanes tereljensis]|nr:hypothetical protein [Actinoplanes tereljensis]
MTKRSVATLAGVALAVTGGTAAFAYASGWFNGEGSTVAAQSSEIKPVQAIATAAGNLWPKHSVDASVTVGNYNEYKVIAKTVKAGSVKVKAYNTPTDTVPVNTCNETNADISLGDPTDTTINPTSWSTQADWIGFVTMGENASPDCANKVLKITFTLDGELLP